MGAQIIKVLYVYTFNAETKQEELIKEYMFAKHPNAQAMANLAMYLGAHRVAVADRHINEDLHFVLVDLGRALDVEDWDVYFSKFHNGQLIEQ